MRYAFALFLLLGVLGLEQAESARADCKWPPLNAVEQRQSNPVRVGDATFTTGFYSYQVAAYHIDVMHCLTSINWGPREWAVAIGLGGDEPIGPRILQNGPRNTTASSTLNAGPANGGPTATTNSPSTNFLDNRARTPLTSLAAMAPLPPLARDLPDSLPATLPALAPLPALASNQAIIPLPTLNAPAPLPALRPLTR